MCDDKLINKKLFVFIFFSVDIFCFFPSGETKVKKSWKSLGYQISILTFLLMRAGPFLNGFKFLLQQTMIWDERCKRLSKVHSFPIQKQKNLRI